MSPAGGEDPPDRRRASVVRRWRLCAGIAARAAGIQRGHTFDQGLQLPGQLGVGLLQMHQFLAKPLQRVFLMGIADLEFLDPAFQGRGPLGVLGFR